MAVQNPSDKRRLSVDVLTSKTLTAADAGIVQNVIRDGVVITLPPTAVDLVFTVRAGGTPVTNGPVGTGSNKSQTVNFTPNAADGFTGAGFTPAVSKGAVDALATQMVGDEISVIGTGVAGAGGWIVLPGVVGNWTRQP